MGCSKGRRNGTSEYGDGLRLTWFWWFLFTLLVREDSPPALIGVFTLFFWTDYGRCRLEGQSGRAISWAEKGAVSGGVPLSTKCLRLMPFHQSYAKKRQTVWQARPRPISFFELSSLELVAVDRGAERRGRKATLFDRVPCCFVLSRYIPVASWPLFSSIITNRQDFPVLCFPEFFFPFVCWKRSTSAQSIRSCCDVSHHH